MLGVTITIMGRYINTKFNNEINAFIVLMPEYITLNELHRWKKEFLKSLYERAGNEKVALLMDMNTHQFESIESLKLLRNLLSNELKFKNNISKVAFVQPRQYRVHEITSPTEAYFSHFEEAHNWLKQLLN